MNVHSLLDLGGDTSYPTLLPNFTIQIEAKNT